MNISALKEVFKEFAQALHVSTLFPAAVFVLVNFYLLAPYLNFENNDPEAEVMLLTSLTLVMSYTLYAFNFPLIRFFEGYKFQNLALFKWRLAVQKKEFEQLVHSVRRYRLMDEEWNDYYHALQRGLAEPKEEKLALYKELQSKRFEWAEAERRLDREFPVYDQQVLPTRLGNTIAAFEDYPRTRYGMNTIALWSRLVPLLKENDYLEFVHKEKSVFDFLLNACFLASLLFIEFFLVAVFLWDIQPFLIIMCVCGATAVFSYPALVIAARQWGTTVRVAFDLYRYELYERLSLRDVYTFEQEFEVWCRVSEFFNYRQESSYPYFKDFLSQYQVHRHRQMQNKS